MKEIKLREKYVTGQHLNSTYTIFAHYWLIKETLSVSKWRMVSDKDNSIMTAFYRVFAEEIKSGQEHHFLCRTDKDKTKKEALEEYEEAREDLRVWGEFNGYETKHTEKLAQYFLTETLRTYQFHNTVSTGGHSYREWANNPIKHPLGSKDRGYYEIDCKTDLSGYSPMEKANLMINVNDNAISSFMQMMRRRLSVLEDRLLVREKMEKAIYTLILILNMLRWLLRYFVSITTTVCLTKQKNTLVKRNSLQIKHLLNDWELQIRNTP